MIFEATNVQVEIAIHLTAGRPETTLKGKTLMAIQEFSVISIMYFNSACSVAECLGPGVVICLRPLCQKPAK